jgi:dTDP-4-dehydrorhamnose reductase
MAHFDSVVLISPDGMLGRAWAELLASRSIAFRGLTYPTFDMTNDEYVRAGIAAGTTLVINCAAWTDVDGAEAREPEATRVNGVAVGALARRCAEVGAFLIHYSTDYVFDGKATTPYATDQGRDPLNAYGRGKAIGEELIVASGCQHMIARTSWLYAAWGNNFVRTIDKLARERASLRVVNDQHGRPTSAVQIGRAHV